MFLKNADKEDGIMHTKTMEGLIGARTNMELLNTPFRVYKEARLKNDTAMMERAMGYMGDFHEEACEYKEEADEGMKMDAEERRRIAQEQIEEAVRKRREEREKLEEKTEEERNADTNTDTQDACLLEISEEGRGLLKDNTDPDDAGSNEIKTDAVKKPVTYTKAGETAPVGQTAGLSVSV